VSIFVESEGRCKGQTIADWHNQWESRPEVEVCMNVDGEGVLGLIEEYLTKDSS